MFNNRNSDFNATYIKNIYVNSCCFKVPKENFTELFDLLNNCANICYNNVRPYSNLKKKKYIFQVIIQAVNNNPLCIQNAVQFTQIFKNSFLSTEEADQCLLVYSSFEKISSAHFVQSLYVKKSL